MPWVTHDPRVAHAAAVRTATDLASHDRALAERRRRALAPEGVVTRWRRPPAPG